MNCQNSCRFLFVFLLSFAAISSGGVRASETKGLPDIYDGQADGSKQVADALAVARKEDKNVLLQFGANWCSWCHKLHDLCASDPKIAAELKNHYVVVLVDVDKGHNQETNLRYGNPTKLGLPVLVVLDKNGQQLTTQDSGKLEEGDHHSPEKVLKFLREWEPKKS